MICTMNSNEISRFHFVIHLRDLTFTGPLFLVVSKVTVLVQRTQICEAFLLDGVNTLRSKDCFLP